MKEIFEICLVKNRCAKLEEETVSNFSEIMKKDATKLAGKTKKEPPVLSTEGQEIRQVENRRKKLRKRENRSEGER